MHFVVYAGIRDQLLKPRKPFFRTASSSCPSINELLRTWLGVVRILLLFVSTRSSNSSLILPT